MSTVHLIIDVQRALCSGVGEVFEAARQITNINLAAAKARDARVLVVFIQRETDEGAFVYGSPGRQLANRLGVEPSDIRIRKRAPDSFHRTELKELSEQHNSGRLVNCGLQSEFCVDTTTRRALALGYPVVLVADGHSTADICVLSSAQISAPHNETLANITWFGPRDTLVPARELQIEAGQVVALAGSD